MLLKADQIAQLLKAETEEDKKDPLVITPRPSLQELIDKGSGSVDLRLGTWFLTMRQSRTAVLNVVKGGKSEPTHNYLTRMHYVAFGEDFILHPRNFVLGVTLEWLRFPRNLAGYLIGRSSWGRAG